MYDMHNCINPIAAIPPQVVSDGSSLVSAAIDRNNFESLTFIVMLGTLADADATWTVTVKEGDTSVQAEHTAVADVDLIGTEAEAGFTFEDDDATRKIGYKGGKRYVSIEIDNDTGNTGNAPIAVLALLGHAAVTPTANPPA